MKKNIKLVLFVEQLFEDLEVWYPKLRLEEEANVTVTIAAPELKTYYGKKGLPVEPTMKIDDVRLEDFDGILIPGGFAPDWLRRIPKVLELVHQCNEENKLVAFICHAGWVPVSAKILKGRKGTSFFAIRDDMENAGMTWEDSAAVTDKNLVSSRVPGDLGAYCKAIIKVLEQQTAD